MFFNYRIFVETSGILKFLRKAIYREIRCTFGANYKPAIQLFSKANAVRGKTRGAYSRRCRWHVVRLEYIYLFMNERSSA